MTTKISLIIPCYNRVDELEELFPTIYEQTLDASNYEVIVVDDAQWLARESLMDLCSLIVCPPKKSAAASLIIVGDDRLARQMNLAIAQSINLSICTTCTQLSCTRSGLIMRN